MKSSKVRRQIAWEAARLIVDQPELRNSDARRQAVERLFPEGIRAVDIPSDAEVSAQIRSLAAASQTAPWSARFEVYGSLLKPLANIKQDPRQHPEGDALYHSLQVFVLAQDAFAYDEEFLTAALLHDVGKAIDRKQPAAATLAALAGIVTQRTLWFIEQLPSAKAHLRGTLGIRARKRFTAGDDFEELTSLAKCDLAGRQRGIVVPELEEALQILEEMSLSHEDHAE